MKGGGVAEASSGSGEGVRSTISRLFRASTLPVSVIHTEVPRIAGTVPLERYLNRKVATGKSSILSAFTSGRDIRSSAGPKLGDLVSL